MAYQAKPLCQVCGKPAWLNPKTITFSSWCSRACRNSQRPSCQLCGKTAWFDPRSQTFSNWCSLSCRFSSKPACQFCGQPAWFDPDKKIYSQWCSQMCQFSDNPETGPQNYYIRSSSDPQNYSNWPANQNYPGQNNSKKNPVCETCKLPAWLDRSTGLYARWCSRTCELSN